MWGKEEEKRKYGRWERMKRREWERAKRRKSEKMDKKKREENEKDKSPGNTAKRRKSVVVECRSIVRRCESAKRRAIAIKNVRVCVSPRVLAARRAGGVYGEALSKYQFETAAAIGMRHAFHRPLRPAFHFYLYLLGRLRPPPSPTRCPPVTRNVVERRQRRRDVALSRYFTTFCFLSAGWKNRGITRHLGPYSTFMALNRDEVSRKWTSPLRFLLLSSLPSLSFSRVSFFFTCDRSRC